MHLSFYLTFRTKNNYNFQIVVYDYDESFKSMSIVNYYFRTQILSQKHIYSKFILITVMMVYSPEYFGNNRIYFTKNIIAKHDET